MSTTKFLLNSITQAFEQAVTYYPTKPNMSLKRGAAIMLLATTAACGGGGGGSGSPTPTPTPPPTPTPVPTPMPTPVPATGKLYLDTTATGGSLLPIGNVAYTSTPVPTPPPASTTKATGDFGYMTGGATSFSLAGTTFASIPAGASITQKQLASTLCSGSTQTDCAVNVESNLKTLVYALDDDGNSTNGFNLTAQQSTLPALDFKASPANFGDALQAAGVSLVPSFTPFLGINTEEPQPESDTVGGQALLFADVFRVARPFKEYSCPDITYDANGWPTAIPTSCATQTDSLKKVASTFMFRYVPDGAIPEGDYTVLYDGSGTLAYSGIATGTNTKTGRDVITVKVTGTTTDNYPRTAGLRVQITATDPNNPLRNIRIVMPGGICTSNIYKRVNSSVDCPKGDYQSFESQLSADRNKIVFNPDYLREMRNFKVLRTMNLMKASPSWSQVAKTVFPKKDASGNVIYDAFGNPTYDIPNPPDACYYKNTANTTVVDAVAFNKDYNDCILQPFTWSQRSTLNNAVWGGSANTSILQRYGRGVPLEVLIELANTLKMDPWFNIPHSADDDYVRQFATMVNARLDPTLKPYIEYSNETWNGIFWANTYVRLKGMALGLGNAFTSKEYWAGPMYNARRSKEIFAIWSDVYGTNSRFVRVLAGNYNDLALSKNMLEFENTASVTDALAIAPYFRGCWDRSNKCANTTDIPILLSQVTSVDQIFDIINSTKEPYGLPTVIEMIKSQKTLASSKNVSLVAYEGGQHLAVTWPSRPARASFADDVTYNAELEKYNAEMARLNGVRALFEAANRDPRMGEAYTKLLTEWKNAGGKLFVVYTAPQSFHQWGSWGIKEHLNKLRAESPKFDAIMKFQETWMKAWY